YDAGLRSASSLNKQHVNKSIYSQLLIFQRISPECVMLNSTRRSETANDHDKTFTPRRIEFSHTPIGTTINISRSFQMLEDIDRQNLFEWKEEFLQSAKLAQWNEEATLQVLKSSIDSKYFHLIENVTTLDQALSNIFMTKYPSKNYLKYLNLLSHVHQDQFLTIKEYKNYIEETCTRLAICVGWTSEQRSLKVEESFFNGLSKRTQLEMSRLNITKISDMYSIINCTEETLLDQVRDTNHTSARPNRMKGSKGSKPNSKNFCKHHGECNHSTQECRYLNNGDYKTKHSDSKKENFALRTDEIDTATLNLTANIEGNSYKAVLDTGSTFSYLGKEIIKKHKIKTQDIKESVAVLVNGVRVKTDKAANIQFKLENDNSSVYINNFKILNVMDNFLILGMDFLTKNRVKIDLENKFVKINDTELEINVDVDSPECDKLLDSNNKIYQLHSLNENHQLRQLLKENERIINVGRIPNVKHSIILTENKIINKPSYRIPPKLKEMTLTHVNQLEKDNIIRQSNSEFSSPCFPILKKDGSIRLVIDYRDLNKYTKPVHYIFPKINDIFYQLHGMTIFSKIDLKAGYYQIEMESESISYTTFSIENKKYEWLRMPFGLTNAPKTFQKVMDRLFDEVKFAIPYLDDIIVFSAKHGDHSAHLSAVIQILNENNIKINLAKCEFFKEKISFLGHQISSNGISPLIEKIPQKIYD
ncbi:Retrovirus-related Pol polyprotein from transposon, partial [Dictyocoela roeselum]